jgi:hypothetical protein
LKTPCYQFFHHLDVELSVGLAHLCEISFSDGIQVLIQGTLGLLSVIVFPVLTIEMEYSSDTCVAPKTMLDNLQTVFAAQKLGVVVRLDLQHLLVSDGGSVQRSQLEFSMLHEL